MSQYSETKIKNENITFNKRFINILIVSLISIGTILNVVLTIQYSKKNISLATIFNVLIVYFLTSTLLLVVFMPHPSSKYGLHLNNWKSELFIGFVIGIIAMFISAFVGKSLISTGFKTTENMVLGTHWTGLFSSQNLKFMSFYLIGSFIQETVSKGYFQTYLADVISEREFKGLSSKALAIIISSVFFSLFHAAGGIYLCLITFAFSCLLGMLFEKNRSLIAISLIHFFCGTGAFLVSLYI